jgi:hypothetical protein
MPILSLRIFAVLAIVFLLTEAPGQRLFFGKYTPGAGDADLFYTARADTRNETDAALVDCVIPGKIRPLGSTTYITREQTIKTTEKDCEARGGKPANPVEPEAEIHGGEPAEQDDHSHK